MISQQVGIKYKYFDISENILFLGILHSQRVLAEITEMVRISNIIHKSVLNVSKDDAQLEDLNFGNKLSLLTGDYLLSNSFKELAGLKCHDVNELISTCLRDLVEADFIEPRDRYSVNVQFKYLLLSQLNIHIFSQNRPLPAKPLGKQGKIVEVPNQFDENILKISEILGNAKAEWTLRHLLDGASLLAKCCQVRTTY